MVELPPEFEVKNDTGVSAPVSVTASVLPTGAATSATQTSGAQRTQIVDPDNDPITSIDIGDGTRAMKVAQSANHYFFSSDNSTTAQIAAGATFNGAIETIINQQNYSILLTSDQPGILTIYQYIDAAGAFLTQTLVFPISAGNGFTRSGVINGNYLKVTFVNNGASATTTLNINTAYGTILPATQFNNTPVENFPVDSFKHTYSAAISALVPAGSPTDIMTITGSATKTIRITMVEISGTTSSGSGIRGQANLIRRSTPNTGGTSTSPTRVSHDSTNIAPTATVLAYTANPTLGTTVGTIRSMALTFLASGSAASLIDWFFGDRPAQAVILRGTNQVIAINLGGVTVTGGQISGSIEWTEEN